MGGAADRLVGPPHPALSPRPAGGESKVRSIRGEAAAHRTTSRWRQRFAVEPVGLDLGGAAQLLQLRVDDVVRHQLADLLARFLEARRRADAMVFDLDHMPAELGLDRRLGVLARGQREGGVGELLDHVVMAEIAEIAARAAAGVGRMLLGEFGEIGSFVELGDDRLRLGLGLDQDVPGMHLFVPGLLLGEGLVACLELVLGLGVLDRLVEIGFLDQAILVALQPELHLGILVEMSLAAGLGDQHAVDEPVEQHRIDLGERHLLDLGRQALLRRLDIRKVQLGAVDTRHDHAARRQRAGIVAAGFG